MAPYSLNWVIIAPILLHSPPFHPFRGIIHSIGAYSTPFWMIRALQHPIWQLRPSIVFNQAPISYANPIWRQYCSIFIHVSPYLDVFYPIIILLASLWHPMIIQVVSYHPRWLRIIQGDTHYDDPIIQLAYRCATNRYLQVIGSIHDIESHVSIDNTSSLNE